ADVRLEGQFEVTGDTRILSTPGPPPPGSHPTVTRDFALYLTSRFVSATAATLLRSSVAWHVYHLSQSAFHLGLIGLVQFLPALGLTLIGGAVADSHDRRRIINGAQILAASAG